jgi:solute carrier family 25 uncoupling protein 27
VHFILHLTALHVMLQVRMQADARAVQLGQQQLRRYPNLMAAAMAVWKEAGLLGMWRGGLPAVQRAALVNLGELATYDQVC